MTTKVETLKGQVTHVFLGAFEYEVTFQTRHPESTWLVDWEGNAFHVKSGHIHELSGDTFELLVGSDGAAPIMLHKQIQREINAL